MKFINMKMLKYAIGILFTLVLLGGIYVMIVYKTFGGPIVALTANTDFTYLESFFEKENTRMPLYATSTAGAISTSTIAHAIKIPIVIYHSVHPYIHGESIMQDRFDITPELFEEQLIYLRDHGYTTVSLDDLARDMKQGTTTTNLKPVALTFDDGLENQHTYAFPLLKKYGMIATFYVYTNPIDRKNKHYLSWDQLREMSSAGMTIGSHSLSHPLFKNSTPLEIQKELTQSKATIERELGKPALHFAQPFGYTSPEIEQAIKEAGYVTARGVRWGTIHGEEDRYYLNGYFTSDNFKDFVRIVNTSK